MARSVRGTAGGRQVSPARDVSVPEPSAGRGADAVGNCGTAVNP
jgi:hypothetical protein